MTFISPFFVALLLTQAAVAPTESGGQRDTRAERQKQAAIARFKAKLNRTFVYLKSERHLYDLLRFRPIREELEVSAKTSQKIQGIKSEADRRILDFYQEHRKKGPEMAYLAFRFDNETRASSIEAIRNLLTEKQRKRLRQLALYCEIDYLGLDVALTEGELGAAAGVTENQKTHLAEVVQRVMDQSRVATAKAHRMLHERILSTLAPSERTVVEKRLGPFFDIYAGRWLVVRDVRSDFIDELSLENEERITHDTTIIDEAEKRGRRIGWSQDFKTKYGILFDTQVQEDLALSAEQRDAISAGGPLTVEIKGRDAEAFLERASQRIDEILSPTQQERLDQLGNYLDIASRGYADFLTGEPLATQLGMTADRRAKLFMKISAMEIEHASSMVSIKRGILESAINELSTQQKSDLRSALGDYFYCPPTLFEYARQGKP